MKNACYLPNAAMMLSMDLVYPLYSHLGFLVLDAQAFQANVRIGLQNAKEFVGKGAVEVRGDSMQLADFIRPPLSHVHWDAFENWVDKYYHEDPAEHRPLLVWRGILAKASNLKCSVNPIEDPEARSAIEGVRRCLKLPSHFDEIWQKNCEGNLSQWDTDLLVKGMWDDEETFGLDALYLRLHTICLVAHEYSCWRYALQDMGHEQVDVIHDWGLRVGEIIGFRPESVCSPGKLVGEA